MSVSVSAVWAGFEARGRAWLCPNRIVVTASAVRRSAEGIVNLRAKRGRLAEQDVCMSIEIAGLVVAV